VIKTYSTYDIRARAVRALRGGMSVNGVADAYQVERTTLWRWARRYDEGKLGGLQRRRRPGSGRPRKLEGLGSRIFRRIVMRPASKFGYETDLWTSARLLQVIRKESGRDVSRQTVWRRLREARLTYQKPEKRYFEASKELRAEWLQTELPKIRDAVEKYRAILYFEDEAHVSLAPVLGKTWAPVGQTPIQAVTSKRGGIAAMSAISKNGGLVFRLLEKRINSADIIRFLKQMLKHHPRRHLVIVMDQAPCHKSAKTKAFVKSQRRLHVFYLPSYSPDWNPDEKVWSHLKHHELKSHQARTKDEMKHLTSKKLAKMQRDPHLLRGIFFRCFVADLL
jgi:transposase